MLDKLNGILVKDTVIELLKSYLADQVFVAAQKNSLWLTNLPKEVHVRVKDYPFFKTPCIIWARLKSVKQSSMVLMGREHSESF